MIGAAKGRWRRRSPAARLLCTAHTAVPGTAAPVPASPYGRWAIAQRFARRRVGRRGGSPAYHGRSGGPAERTNRWRTAARRTAITPAPGVIFQSHRRPERTQRRSVADRRTQNTPAAGPTSEQSAVAWFRVLSLARKLPPAVPTPPPPAREFLLPKVRVGGSKGWRAGLRQPSGCRAGERPPSG